MQDENFFLEWTFSINIMIYLNTWHLAIQNTPCGFSTPSGVCDKKHLSLYYIGMSQQNMVPVSWRIKSGGVLCS